MKARIFLLGVFTLSLMACKRADPTADQKDQQGLATEDLPEPMTVIMDSLIKKGGPCLTESDCMEIKVHWPIVKGGNEKIRKIMNDSIYKFVLQNLDYYPDRANLKIEQVADSMLAFFTTELKENEDHAVGWEVEVDAEMEFHDEIGVLELFNYSYMGGAHPNHYSGYTNFNTNTGQIIKYSDFVTDTTAFKAIIETKFLADAKEKAEESFTIDDFFWGSGFQLPTNFKLGEKSLEVLYNPYEAAAYVFGEFILEIPYEELRGVIDLELLKNNN